MLKIESLDNNSLARTGTIGLPHGEVRIPAFMPVGTNATVKAISHHDVEKIGYRLILANTYHLFLRPGKEVFTEYGGLHTFSSWNHNILTDSGGFQVFSLALMRKIRDEGVRFQSHIDGSYHVLTPESVVDFQETLGSDILMCLDECTAPDISYKKALEASNRTTDWARRSKKRWEQRPEGYDGKLFGIIQGNFYEDLRKKSAEEIIELDFPGIAIGGLSVGEPYAQFLDYLAYTARFLPENKPRYLMGIGTPDYIFAAVENGIDLFDCVFATRTARNGTVFTRDGMISLKKVVHATDREPIVPGCSCKACTTYSRGYLRHLFKAGEIFGPMLATEHNLQFLYDLMVSIRKSIENGTFTTLKKDFLDRYGRKGR
jgi:queuine tRNA-ribosyltransferase